MKPIGKGSFTRAYLLREEEALKYRKKFPKGEVVFLKSVDVVKEAFSESVEVLPHQPEIKQVGYRKYVMPLYTKVRAVKKQLSDKDYKAYSYLRRRPSGVQGFHGLNTYFEAMEDCPIKTAVLDQLFQLSNWIDPPDIGFEISPRNIAIDSDGRLILLDCFFSTCLLAEYYE